MEIKLLGTLKGAEVYKKGRVFNDALAPIPKDILDELALDRTKPLVRVTMAEKTAVVAAANEPKTEQDEIPPYLLEIEELIQRLGSPEALAKEIGVNAHVVGKYRSRAFIPKEDIRISIGELLANLKERSTDDNGRAEDLAPGGAEGTN